MKHTLITILLVLGCAYACAAPMYSEEADPFTVKQSSQTNFSSSAYSSTVYQPFSNTTPSQQSSASDGGNSDPRSNSSDNGLDDGFILGPDTNQSDESPVGEPWVMLVFAAMAAGVIAYRRKKEPTRAP